MAAREVAGREAVPVGAEAAGPVAGADPAAEVEAGEDVEVAARPGLPLRRPILSCASSGEAQDGPGCAPAPRSRSFTPRPRMDPRRS